MALLALLSVAPGKSEEGLLFKDTGPLRIRNQFLLNTGFLGFTPVSANVLSAGRWQLDLTETVSNTFAHSRSVANYLDQRHSRSSLTLNDFRSIPASNPKAPIFQLDGEVYRTTVSARRGVGNGWQIEVNLPIIDMTGGHLDALIEDFHRAFSLDQAGRLGAPRNRFLIYLRDAQGEYFRNQSPGLSLGDTVISVQKAAYWSTAINPRAIRFEVKLPTGSSRSLTGSGSFDFGIELLAGHYFHRSSWHASIGIIKLGPWRMLGLGPQHVISGMVSYEYALTPRSSAVVQTTVSQAPFHSLGLDLLSPLALQMSAGIKLSHGPDLTWFTAVTENLIHLNNTADIGIHFGVTETF